MTNVKKIVEITGVVEEPIGLNGCRPGLVLVEGELAFSRGDGYAYWLRNGKTIQTKRGSRKPEDGNEEEKIVQPVRLDQMTIRGSAK